jgi:hypothetical protein
VPDLCGDEAEHRGGPLEIDLAVRRVREYEGRRRHAKKLRG